MSTPVIIGADQHGVKITVRPHHPDLSPGRLRPLDLEQIEGHVQAAAQQIMFNAQAYKFLHDLKLLRAAQYAMSTGHGLEDALELVESDRDAELKAQMLLTGVLIQAGWRQTNPDRTPDKETRTENPGGIFRTSFPEQKGKDCSGDVLVNTATGMCVVADAISAFTYRWLLVPSKEPITITDDGNWWWTRNWSAPFTRYQDDERREAWRSLSIPAVPVDLEGLLAYLTRE